MRRSSYLSRPSFGVQFTAAGVSVLNCKDRRDAIIIFCIDRGCSLQKVNEELYRFGEETVS